MINMTNRPHIHVRLRPLERLLSHELPPSSLNLSLRSRLNPKKWSPRPGSNRGNLFLTKEVLYLLSYVGTFHRSMKGCMERETGFEPATLSLEG